MNLKQCKQENWYWNNSEGETGNLEGSNDGFKILKISVSGKFNIFFTTSLKTYVV